MLVLATLFLALAHAVRVGNGDGGEQRLRVLVLRVGVDLLGAAPASTIWPLFITAMSSLIVRTTARSWAMKR